MKNIDILRHKTGRQPIRQAVRQADKRSAWGKMDLERGERKERERENPKQKYI